MFTTLRKTLGMTVFVSTLAASGGAFADGNVIPFGSLGNCAAGQTCTVGVVYIVGFGGLGSGVAGSAAEKTDRGAAGGCQAGPPQGTRLPRRSGLAVRSGGTGLARRPRLAVRPDRPCRPGPARRSLRPRLDTRSRRADRPRLASRPRRTVRPWRPDGPRRTIRPRRTDGSGRALRTRRPSRPRPCSARLRRHEQLIAPGVPVDRDRWRGPGRRATSGPGAVSGHGTRHQPKESSRRRMARRSRQAKRFCAGWRSR